MKTGKRMLSVILAALMLLTAAPLAGLVGMEIAPKVQAYQVGDRVQFGTYPRSRVTNEERMRQLDTVEKEWKSFNFFCGTGTEYDGLMHEGDFMKYADFFYEGVRYRALRIDSYRPTATHNICDSENSIQDDNGYYENSVYYFVFEAIPWRILDLNTGLILCEDIIDSQPFQNTIYLNGREYYTGLTSSFYANDYGHSFIRGWLNDDFYNTAFTNSQKANIIETELSNDYDYPQFSFEPTNDRVFLLSLPEATNKSYGFSEKAYESGTNDTDYSKRSARITEYARSQGIDYKKDLGTRLNGGTSWWLRTGGSLSSRAMIVRPDGSISLNEYPANRTNIGIRPACRLATIESNIINHDHEYNVTVEKPKCLEFGYSTYSCKYCDFSYSETVDPLGHTSGKTIIENEVPATCKVNGSYEEVVYCSACGDELSRKTVPINKLEHVPSAPIEQIVTAATCTEPGEKIITVYCNECGSLLSEETLLISALHHNYIATITPATCTAVGYTTYTCNRGDHTYISDYTEKTKHKDIDNDGFCDICDNQMSGGQHCIFCGKIHDGPFGWMIKFFHSILAIFKR